MKLHLLTAALAFSAATAAAQTPRVVNAALEQRAVAGPLDVYVQTIVRQQSSPAWLAYSVPAVPGHQVGCCGTGETSTGGAPCYLEGRSGTTVNDERPVRLEGDATLLVLFRIERQQVGKIRVFSPDCPLDAGGLPFVVLTGVTAADSVRLLASYATARADVTETQAARRGDPVARAAVTALALHGDPSADSALQQLVTAQQPLEVRKQAAFWLGTARGQRGYEILRAAVERDPSADFRRQAAFAFSQSQAAGALDTLIAMAKSDADPGVRGQALFWLAQKAGRKAVGAISDAIENDPQSQVKERAVFALSQLPKDEGVPLLIDVARTNRDPNVRKRAMFWLGQSKDPRALAFFEQVLKGR